MSSISERAQTSMGNTELTQASLSKSCRKMWFKDNLLVSQRYPLPYREVPGRWLGQRLKSVQQCSSMKSQAAGKSAALCKNMTKEILSEFSLIKNELT